MQRNEEKYAAPSSAILHLWSNRAQDDFRMHHGYKKVTLYTFAPFTQHKTIFKCRIGIPLYVGFVMCKSKNVHILY